MAGHLGEQEKAREYYDLFEKGREWVDINLFNGQYYYHSLNLKDSSVLKNYKGVKDHAGCYAVNKYWNDEAKEMKYQIAKGCMTDQVIAQWHANICGLGEIFNKKQTFKALKSIYKYNFKKSIRNHFNPCRIYSLNGEAGTVICEWPKGKYKPVIPAPYSEETWSGCEYQAAAHMIQEGLVDEGLKMVKAVRNRYDGEKRNPWNEFECGSNYARSMASYTLLTALSGFEFDMVEGMIGFNPVCLENNKFKSFWCLDSGWGIFCMGKQFADLKVLYGKLNIKKIKLGFIEDKNIKHIALNGQKIDFSHQKDYILLNKALEIRKGEVLSLNL